MFRSLLYLMVVVEVVNETVSVCKGGNRQKNDLHPYYCTILLNGPQSVVASFYQHIFVFNSSKRSLK